MSSSIRPGINAPVCRASGRHVWPAFGLVVLCTTVACSGDDAASPTDPAGAGAPVVASLSPDTLVEGGSIVIRGVPLYDVNPDDRRFLMVTAYSPREWRQGDAAYSRRWYWSDEIQAKLRR